MAKSLKMSQKVNGTSFNKFGDNSKSTLMTMIQAKKAI